MRLHARVIEQGFGRIGDAVFALQGSRAGCGDRLGQIRSIGGRDVDFRAGIDDFGAADLLPDHDRRAAQNRFDADQTKRLVVRSDHGVVRRGKNGLDIGTVAEINDV